MPICPKCGAGIEVLEETALQEIRSVFRAGCEREPDDSTHSSVTGWQIAGQKFSCPECHGVLFTDEDEANDFLLGKEQEEHNV